MCFLSHTMEKHVVVPRAVISVIIRKVAGVQQRLMVNMLAENMHTVKVFSANLKVIFRVNHQYVDLGATGKIERIWLIMHGHLHTCM